MSSGVAPAGDIRLTGEEDDEVEEGVEEAARPGGAFKPTSFPRPRFLSLRQLNVLAAIVVLSSSGLVAPEDFAFFAFSLAYAYFLSRFVFPAQSPHADPLLDERSLALLGLYVLGAALGLLLPAAYIFEGIAEGDKEGVTAAAPHFFLLSSQVFTEGLTAAGGFSPPARIFVPVLYNTRRIFAIVDWLRAEVGKLEVVAHQRGPATRVGAGRWLATANLLFWSFNLFGFLLPVCLPRAFKRYYGHGAKP